MSETLYFVRAWRPRPRQAALAEIIGRYSSRAEAEARFRGRFTNAIRVDLEQWEFSDTQPRKKLGWRLLATRTR